MSAPLTPAAYQPHLNEPFTIHHGGETSTFTLTEVKTKIDDEFQLCFVLHFSGQSTRLPQAIYRISHNQLGEFDLFLVPIQPRKGGALYEAVFNLLKDSAP